MVRGRLQVRKAFTLAELLVVIGIIGTLVALLVPAVQKAREAANRAACVNNLRQLGLAAHNYASARGALPPAVEMSYAQWGDARLDDDTSQPFGPNWAVLLLPFVEQADLYQSVDVDAYLRRGDQGWRQLRGVSIHTFLCPSDSGKPTPFAGTTNGDGIGSHGSGTLPEGGDWARGNYAANAGTGLWRDTVGGGLDRMEISNQLVSTRPVMGINYGAKLGPDIPDGTSNTVLFNEVRIGISSFDRRGSWAMGFPGASVTVANAYGDCTTPNNADDLADDIQGCDEFWYPGIGTHDRMGCNWNFGTGQAQARSLHLGGVNACFADGSVHFIENNIDQLVWAYLLSPTDGVAAEIP